MRRVCAYVLSIVFMLGLIASSVPVASVSAAADVVYTIQTVKTNGIKAGSTFTVNVSTNKLSKICMVEFFFAYDATKVKAVKGVVKGFLSEFSFKKANVAPVEPKHSDPNIGEVWITGMNLKDKTAVAGEVIATITFEALKDIKSDLKMYSFQKPLAAYAPVNPLTTEAVNGGVDVQTTTTKTTTKTTKTTAKTTTKTTTTKKVTTTTKKTTTTTKPIYFPDVKKGDWYYDAVQYVARREYMTGFKNGNFGPAENMQRQDFVLILSRIADADLTKYKGKTGGLKDVDKNAYYAPAVAWAVDQGIVTGYKNGKFGVGDPITREQVCTIFYRYKGSPKVSGAETTLKKYPDSKVISPFAKDAVVWASQKNVMTGMKSGNFSPQSNAARAQVATIVMRMDQAKMFK